LQNPKFNYFIEKDLLVIEIMPNSDKPYLEISILIFEEES